jgi:hypothetical protein
MLNLPLLADGDPRVVMQTMDGVTTAITLFLFACLVVPNFIRNRTQYYVAFASVLGIILMHALSLMFGGAGFATFAAVVIGFLQFVGVMMLVMCAGGLSAKSLASEMSNAYEVIRRGEQQKEVIIPLTGAQAKSKAHVADEDDDEGRVVYSINSPQVPPTPNPEPPTPADKSIPLED